jgi:predicted O-methyltransferase YrrM
MYKFNNNWFDCSQLKNSLELLSKYLDYNNKSVKLLEIGSYEGASACFFSDNLLHLEDSELTCVDPFCLEDETTPVYETTENTFLDNIKKSKGYKKIIFKKMFSKEFYIENTKKFDFVYIDGSHKVQDIILDFNNCLHIINTNGIIWMDDYLGGDNHIIKNCIDELYNKNKDKLDIIYQGYQIAFVKKLDCC